MYSKYFILNDLVQDVKSYERIMIRRNVSGFSILSCSKKDGDNNHQEQWSEIKQYFHVNHHLHTADQSRAVVKVTS